MWTNSIEAARQSNNAPSNWSLDAIGVLVAMFKKWMPTTELQELVRMSLNGALTK